MVFPLFRGNKKAQQNRNPLTSKSLFSGYWYSPLMFCNDIPDSKVLGPTWGPSGADRTQMGPMLVPWTLLSGIPSPNSAEATITIFIWMLLAQFGSPQLKACYLIWFFKRKIVKLTAFFLSALHSNDGNANDDRIIIGNANDNKKIILKIVSWWFDNNICIWDCSHVCCILNLVMSIFVYIYVCVCICIYIYKKNIYIKKYIKKYINI